MPSTPSIAMSMSPTSMPGMKGSTMRTMYRAAEANTMKTARLTCRGHIWKAIRSASLPTPAFRKRRMPRKIVIATAIFALPRGTSTTVVCIMEDMAIERDRTSFLRFSAVPVLSLHLPVPPLAGPYGGCFDGVALHEPAPGHGAVRRADGPGLEPDPVALDPSHIRGVSETPLDAPLGEEPAVAEGDGVLIAPLFPFFPRLRDERLPVEEVLGEDGSLGSVAAFRAPCRVCRHGLHEKNDDH